MGSVFFETMASESIGRFLFYFPSLHITNGCSTVMTCCLITALQASHNDKIWQFRALLIFMVLNITGKEGMREIQNVYCLTQ